MGKLYKVSYFESSLGARLGQGNCAKCGEFGRLDGHHIMTKSRGGSDFKVVGLCRACHNEVGLKIIEAEKAGLYKRGYKITKEKE